MSDNTTGSEKKYTAKELKKVFIDALEKGKWLPNPKLSPCGMTNEEYFEEYTEEKKLFVNDGGEAKASGVRVNALVNCMERIIAESPELLNESNEDDMNNGLWVEKPNSGEVLYLRYDFVTKTIKEGAEYS